MEQVDTDTGPTSPSTDPNNIRGLTGLPLSMNFWSHRETSANMAAGCWSGDQAVGLGRRPLPDGWCFGINCTEDLTCMAVDWWRRRRRSSTWKAWRGKWTLKLGLQQSRQTLSLVVNGLGVDVTLKGGWQDRDDRSRGVKNYCLGGWYSWGMCMFAHNYVISLHMLYQVLVLFSGFEMGDMNVCS